jgi:hypothetical protein
MRRMRRLGVLPAASCVVGGLLVAWLLARGAALEDRSSAPVSPNREPVPSQPEPEVDLRAPPHSPFPPWTTAALWSEPVQDFQSQPPRPQTLRPFAPGTLEGSVSARTPEGALLPPQSGAISFTIGNGNGGFGEEIEFHRGRWTLELPERADWTRLEIADVIVAGVHVAIESPREYRRPLPVGGIEIQVTLPRLMSLRVVDAESGANLEAVEVVLPREFPLDDALHPGMERDARVLLRSVRSPVELPQSLFDARSWGHVLGGQRELRVGAEGYAWADVSLDLLRGGERVVGLRRAATLEVTLLGSSRDLQAELRVRESADLPLLASEPAGGDGALRITGLPPGRLSAGVEIGFLWNDPLVLGSVEVQLVAGATTAIAIALDAPPPVDRAPASGLILIPVAWDVDHPRPTLVLLDTALDGGTGFIDVDGRAVPSPRAGHRAYRWSHPGLQFGRYELRLYRPRGSMVFEVGPGGASDVLFVLPPPVELLVRLVEAGTALDIRTDELQWHPEIPDGVKGWSTDTLEFDAGSGLYRARVPAAPIVLTCWTMEFEAFQRQLDSAAIAGVVTIELQPASGIAVALRDGDAPVAFPESWWSKPVAEGDSGGEVGLSRMDRFLREYQVSAPGVYQLELPTIDGYRADPPLRIEVRAGEFTRVDVALRRGPGG